MTAAPSRTNVLDGLENRYELIRDIKGCVSGGRVQIGRNHECRYCGTNETEKFRRKAHTLPEALGNKWIFSLDECDNCNDKFSLYESSLAEAVSPFLTLGGVKGKGSQPRQTGRTGGKAVLQRRRQSNGQPSILATSAGVDLGEVASFGGDGKIRLRIPIADVRFRPQHAYKALSKIGFALLPDEELPNFQKLRAWLLDPNDSFDFPFLEVAMSFASIGRTLPLVSASLLRRVDKKGMTPHILCIFCAGSVCFQIDLLSDHLEDHIPAVPLGSVKIQYTVLIGDDVGKVGARIQYVDPVHLNWSNRETAPQPIKELYFDFDPTTTIGSFTPVFR